MSCVNNGIITISYGTLGFDSKGEGKTFDLSKRIQFIGSDNRHLQEQWEQVLRPALHRNIHERRGRCTLKIDLYDKGPGGARNRSKRSRRIDYTRGPDDQQQLAGAQGIFTARKILRV